MSRTMRPIPTPPPRRGSIAAVHRATRKRALEQSLGFWSRWISSNGKTFRDGSMVPSRLLMGSARVRELRFAGTRLASFANCSAGRKLPLAGNSSANVVLGTTVAAAARFRIEPGALVRRLKPMSAIARHAPNTMRGTASRIFFSTMDERTPLRGHDHARQNRLCTQFKSR